MVPSKLYYNKVNFFQFQVENISIVFKRKTTGLTANLLSYYLQN